MSTDLHPSDAAPSPGPGQRSLAAIVARRVSDDPEALRELAPLVRRAQHGAAIVRKAEREMLRVIDRYAARRQRERGAA